MEASRDNDQLLDPHEMLRMEVGSLRKQLYESESIHRQLEQEEHLESLDPRRIRILKSQIIQLERQVNLMAKYMSSTKERLISAEGALIEASEFLSNQLEQATGIKPVTFTQSAIKSQIRRYETLAYQIKQLQDSQASTSSQMIHNKSEFIKKSSSPTLKDISTGGLSHINLQAVSKLECNMCDLYSTLFELQTQLSGTPRITGHLPHLKPTLTTALTKLKTVSVDLMSLSVLVPSAPWKRPSSLPEVSVTSVMAALPKMTAAKTSEVKKLMSTVLKLVDFRHRILSAEVSALNRMVGGETESRESSLDYTMALVDTLTGAFNQQQDELRTALMSPLNDIVESFRLLMLNPSDQVLKSFLGDMKDKVPLIEDSVKNYASLQMDPTALNKYKESFRCKLVSCLDSNSSSRAQLHQERRDMLAKIEETLTELKILQTAYSKPANVSNIAPTSQEYENLPPRSVANIESTETQSLYDEPPQTLQLVAERSALMEIPPSAHSFIRRIEGDQELVERLPEETVSVSNVISPDVSLQGRSILEKDSGLGSIMDSPLNSFRQQKTPRDSLGSTTPTWMLEMQSDLRKVETSNREYGSHMAGECENRRRSMDITPRSSAAAINPKVGSGSARRRARPVDGIPITQLELIPKSPRT